MFDITELHTHSSYGGPSRIDVTERRAPTDDSARLLSELEQKARERIVETVRLENNKIEAIAQREMSFTDGCDYIYVMYMLNGQRRDIKIEMAYDTKIRDQIEPILKALSEDIASFLLGHVGRSLSRKDQLG